MRAVLDANVLISAFISPGICRSILQSLEDNRFTLILSPALLEDLLRAIEKPKLKKIIPPELLERAISLIHQKAVIVEPKIKVRICRDPADDVVLETALAARAVIVTGDNDLLSLTTRRVSILSPRAFATKLRLK